MTLQEILKAKGMSDEDIEATIGEMKQNKIFTTSHENMDVRYPKLKADHDTLTSQHGEATKLIDQFKAGAKDNEALQGKITTYESTIADLTKQLNEQKLDAAMDRKLTAAGAKPEDFDYLKFQWKKKGEITLDDNGEIKGGDDAIAGLKTQHPVQFTAANTQREIEEHQLPDRNKQEQDGMTKAEFLRKPYAERVAFANENPEAYKTIMNH
jgi:hypothetical protein